MANVQRMPTFLEMLRNRTLYPRRGVQLCGVSRTSSGPPSGSRLKHTRRKNKLNNRPPIIYKYNIKITTKKMIKSSIKHSTRRRSVPFLRLYSLYSLLHDRNVSLAPFVPGRKVTRRGQLGQGLRINGVQAVRVFVQLAHLLP